MMALDRSELARQLDGCTLLDDAASVAAANTATFRTTRRSRLIVQPRALDGVVRAVRLASRNQLKIHVVSRGKNWGFGSRVPVSDTDVLLDLSLMNRILSYDPEFGTARVEPGVTFQQLSEFLREQGRRHFLNTIGGAGEASVLGNLLERGDGVGPHCERSEYACSPEVVLADGSVVQTGFENVRGSRVAKLCKNGIGPGLQELFFQSNLGVVTKITIWLCPVPEHFRTIYFCLDRRHDLATLLNRLQGLYRRRVLNAPMTFWNDYKQVATSIQLPWHLHRRQGPLPRATLERISNNYSTWMAFGGIYVDHDGIGRLTQKEIFKQIGGQIRKPSFLSHLDSRKMTAFKLLNRFLKNTRYSFDQLIHGWEHHPLLGHPTEASVRSLFWRKKREPPGRIDPDQQLCGVLWNAFVLPFEGKLIAAALARLDQIILEEGFEPIVSFVLINDRYIKVFQQLIFDREDRREEERALACHARVFAHLEESGYSHHRLDILRMAEGSALMLDDRIHQRIKDALDPDGVLSPGRYFMRSTAPRP